MHLMKQRIVLINLIYLQIKTIKKILDLLESVIDAK